MDRLLFITLRRQHVFLLKGTLRSEVIHDEASFFDDSPIVLLCQLFMNVESGEPLLILENDWGADIGRYIKDV